MNREEFLSGLGVALNWDGPMTSATVVRGHDLWDSTGMLSTIVFIDERLGVTVPVSALESARTAGDLADLVAEQLA